LLVTGSEFKQQCDNKGKPMVK